MTGKMFVDIRHVISPRGGINLFAVAFIAVALVFFITFAAAVFFLVALMVFITFAVVAAGTVRVFTFWVVTSHNISP